MAVSHAVLELAQRISLCVSGINYGENLGSAIGVSGTIGAALEGRCLWHSGHSGGDHRPDQRWHTFGELDWSAARHFTLLLAAQVRRRHAYGRVRPESERAPWRHFTDGTAQDQSRATSVVNAA
jgi:broad specificity polyphosphatase/5'/3'-nucleotidase SurE